MNKFLSVYFCEITERKVDIRVKRDAKKSDHNLLKGKKSN